ncbi:hypothetical protein KK060_22100 [Fulvivirgaceae bacterium PWU20]|uniref:Uncharacterized protein n=1 Tax=Chryseosolibacter indicus TaxID=2782351 RepID=A0ABS5VX59_9BACT|nr:hypothetical protein [Chryseosolibacter indicus]
MQNELELRKGSKAYFSEDFVSIEYDFANHYLYVNWKGYQTEGSVKQGCEKMLEALLHYKCQNILNDNTNVLGIWTPAAQWVGENWLPRMVEAGLKYFAWVYSPSMLSQISTNEALKHTPPINIVKTFYDLESAKRSLTAKK